MSSSDDADIEMSHVVAAIKLDTGTCVNLRHSAIGYYLETRNKNKSKCRKLNEAFVQGQTEY